MDPPRQIDDETLTRARAGRSDDLARVLAAHYPLVWRVCVNLIGRQDKARPVAQAVMSRAVTAAESWDHDDAPARWFRHHALLSAREATPAKPPASDVLVDRGPDDPAYAAFVRAVRALEPQQREALLLSVGEGFDLRSLATAMDCSTEAASVHLKNATATLSAFAGGDYADFVEDLRRAYRASEPDSSLSLPNARRAVRRRVWPARVVGVLGWALLLLLIGGAIYGAALLGPRLIF